MRDTGIFAALAAILIFLALMAWKMRLIHRDTDFLAGIVERNAEQAAQQVEADYEEPAPDRHNTPIGFGVQLRND
jgi:hypothetical protein